MTAETEPSARPWSARRPQSILLSVLLIAVAIALVWQGLGYISQGIGGLVPYLIIVGGPVMAAYYTWYFNFYRFEDAKS